MSKIHELSYLTRFLTGISPNQGSSYLHTATDTLLLILPSPTNPLSYCSFPLFALQVKDCFILLSVFPFTKHTIDAIIRKTATIKITILTCVQMHFTPST